MNRFLMGVKATLLSISLLFALVSASAMAATIDQTYELQPGWNAIYLDHAPLEPNIEAAFAGIPVESVWRYIPSGNSLEFVSNPSEGLEGIEGWYGYIPAPRPAAFLSTLFNLVPNSAYLIKLDAARPYTLTIPGKPAFRAIDWTTDSFTLTGFRVDPGLPPRFADYFASSRAHQDVLAYRLRPSGHWQVVNSANDPIEHGEAYWVFSEGNSDYQGPMQLSLSQEHLSYGVSFDQRRVPLSNVSDLNTNITIRPLQGLTMPMQYLAVDEQSGAQTWPVLQGTESIPVVSGEDIFFDLGVDRSLFTGRHQEQIIEFNNGMGARVLILATANLPALQSDTGATAEPDTGNLADAPVDPEAELAGLWVGTVSINGVSEAQQGDVAPVPTGSEFNLRFIIHVDAEGTVRLLKDVMQMWEDGTERESTAYAGLFETDRPGRQVLLTDESQVHSFKGLTFRGGEPAGTRISTIAYDFPEESAEFTGDFAMNSSIDITLVLEPDAPSNPFRHRHHPDHDNLDEQFLNFKEEAFRVQRNMQFDFGLHNPDFPDIADPPGWGSSRMGGQFSESFEGLHRNTIYTQGDFVLTRVSTISELNQ